MKEVFPNYREIGVKEIEANLNPNDKAILEKHLQFCRMTAGDRKVRDIKRAMLQFRDIIQKDYNKWTRQDLIGFVGLLNNSHMTASSKKEYMCRLKQFVREQYQDLNMLLGVKLKPVRSSINQTRINDKNLIKPDELERLIRSAESLRDKCMLILLFESAGRPEEIMKLRWRDIRFLDGHGEVSLFSGKTQTARVIPINESIVHIKRWKNEYCFPNLRESDFLFPSKEKGKLVRDKHMQSGSLTHLIKKISKKAGIERNLFAYLFRHSRLNEIYKKVTEPVARKFGGHSPKSNMSAVYSHINSDDVIDSMLEKVYHIEEVKKEPELKKEIEELKKNYQRLRNELQEYYKNTPVGN